MYLGSPAISNTADTPNSGLGWLRSFMRQCTKCSIDFITIHWYDRANNAAYFKAHIEAVRDIAAGRPIWISEFKPTDGDDEAKKRFLDEMVPWMDETADIHRYAYFMAAQGEGLLINGKGSGLSSVGVHYLNM